MEYKEALKETIINLLLSTDRPGMIPLVEFMKQEGFFISPCSSDHHCAYYGGLAEHSFNVYKIMLKLAPLICPKEPMDSLIIVSLLHDLGKIGAYHKPNYILNILKSGEVSQSKRYKTNPELDYEEHEIRSLTHACRFISLREEEYTAILHHNGLFGKLDSSYGNHNFDSNRLAFALHTADMYCSRFLEKGDI